MLSFHSPQVMCTWLTIYSRNVRSKLFWVFFTVQKASTYQKERRHSLTIVYCLFYFSIVNFDYWTASRQLIRSGTNGVILIGLIPLHRHHKASVIVIIAIISSREWYSQDTLKHIFVMKRNKGEGWILNSFFFIYWVRPQSEYLKETNDLNCGCSTSKERCGIPPAIVVFF